jgi:hypothetical protein
MTSLRIACFSLAVSSRYRLFTAFLLSGISVTCNVGIQITPSTYRSKTGGKSELFFENFKNIFRLAGNGVKMALGRELLKREIERAALTRMEDAARDKDDFRKVVREWNRLDKNNERRWDRHEVGRPSSEMLHWDKLNENDEKGVLKGWLDTVIPAPLDHVWWRQLLAGNFLDVIFDCPYEMHEQTTSLPVFDILQTLNDNQKEVLYYWAIRQESPRQIAKRRGQTDRNIRKVYDTLITGIRRKLYERLSPRYFADAPLTAAQRQFVADYIAGKFEKESRR